LLYRTRIDYILRISWSSMDRLIIILSFQKERYKGWTGMLGGIGQKKCRWSKVLIWQNKSLKVTPELDL
jgi:hypothetical protein